MKFKGRMTATIVRSSKIAAATDATSARTTISAYGRSATHRDCLLLFAFSYAGHTRITRIPLKITC